MSQRFSDAELAAEWWRTQLDAFVIGEYNKTFEPSWSEIDMADYERHGEIARTIRRFATLPHAHEANLVNEMTKENR